MQFIPATKLTPNEIRAGLDSGVLVAFREDANGVQWFRCMPTMRGVPAIIEGYLEGDNFFDEIAVEIDNDDDDFEGDDET